MVVWAVTVPLFWYVTLRNATALTLRNATALTLRLPPWLARAVALARARHGVVLTVWVLIITAAILERFWLYWSTLVD